jgi:hypothetical protein
MSEVMEELELVQATRSPHGYLASQLSDNIFEKEDGTLIVVGCPIARTGWQKYTVGDLPRGRAEELGVDVSNPSATIELYRPAKEVFAPEFLASLNGCSITDGHPPGGEFVSPDNYNKYSMGHIQNVRRGTEPLEDGEWPIVADLHISAEPLISKVRNKIAREISLGYDFSIDRDGEKIIQCSMLGNHNAVVPKGRAGDLVRIEDAMPEELQASVAIPVTAPTEIPKEEQSLGAVQHEGAAAEVIEAIAYPPIKLSFTKKEKQPVAEKKPSWFRSLMGKHLIEKARATDADPEKFMDEVEAMHEEPTSDKAKAADEVEPPKNTGENEFKSEDKKTKDEEPDEMAEDRKKAHDALDKILDKRGKAKDSNVEALKTLLDKFLSEEEKEPEHADDVDTTELEESLKGEDVKDCAECGMAHDEGEECPGQEEVESGEEVLDEAEDPDTEDPDDDEDRVDEKKADDSARAADGRARAHDSAMKLLKTLRPAVARCKDKAMRNAFNKALDAVKKSSRASTGDYAKFASSARVRDKAPRNPNPDRARAGDGAGKPDQITKLQAFYDAAAKGGK